MFRRLSSTRRKRPIPEGWADAAAIESFDLSQSTDPIIPGPTTLDISEGGVALVGGSDGTAAIALEGSAPVILNVGGAATHGCWWGNQVIVASSTGAITIFAADGTKSGQIGGHSGAVTSLSLHPCGDLLASTGVDKSWILYDLTAMKVATQIHTESGKECTALIHYLDLTRHRTYCWRIPP